MLQEAKSPNENLLKGLQRAVQKQADSTARCVAHQLQQLQTALGSGLQNLWQPHGNEGRLAALGCLSMASQSHKIR